MLLNKKFPVQKVPIEIVSVVPKGGKALIIISLSVAASSVGNLNKSNAIFSKGLRCPSCKQMTPQFDNSQPMSDEDHPVESQSHLSDECDRYTKLRRLYDLNDDQQLVQYFTEVLRIRDLILDEEEDYD